MKLSVSLEYEDWEWLIDFMKQTLDFVDESGDTLDDESAEDVRKFIKIFESVLHD